MFAFVSPCPRWKPFAPNIFVITKRWCTNEHQLFGPTGCDNFTSNVAGRNPMIRTTSVGIAVFVVVLLLSVGAVPTVSTGQPTIGVEQALGKWHSTEQFEGEPRIVVSFRKGDRSIEGWAVLLGQYRKGDNRATLGLSFSEASWNGASMRFSTILPEDEGNIGWELRVETQKMANRFKTTT
jgi:hypothetical protein